VSDTDEGDEGTDDPPVGPSVDSPVGVGLVVGWGALGLCVASRALVDGLCITGSVGVQAVKVSAAAVNIAITQTLMCTLP
jgi:hypothetical protein